jgi:hypothetical protein
LLIGAFVIALVITLFFGFRLVRRILFRPSREPIREWMDVGYIARAYGIPPHVLEETIGIPYGPPPDRRPIGVIAREQGKTAAELVQLIQDRINKGPPYPPPPTRPPPDPPK